MSIINTYYRNNFNFIRYNNTIDANVNSNIVLLPNSFFDVEQLNYDNSQIWQKQLYYYYDMSYNIDNFDVLQFQLNNYLKLNKQFQFPKQFTFIFQFKFNLNHFQYQQCLFNFSDILYVDFNDFLYNQYLNCFFYGNNILYQINQLKKDQYNTLIIRYKKEKLQLIINGQKIIRTIIFNQSKNSNFIFGCKAYQNENIKYGFSGSIKDIKLYNMYKQDKQLFNYL